jgi:hypothetical protein
VTAGRAAALVLLAIAACAPVPPPEPPPAPPPPVAAPAGPSCAAALDAAGARWEPAPDRSGPGRCRLADAVQLSSAGVALDQPATLACAMAERLLAFEREVVEPAARRHFGRALTRIRHFGAYSCRARPDGRTISQHAFGMAIDIAGFDLEGGIRVDVGTAWRDRGARGAFLREVAAGACRMFDVVLTPKSDAFHQNHLHLDLGRDRRCDA